jgi:two-component sensor histidine kinase
MRPTAAERFAALPTAAKLLLILTLVLLPIGLALVWVADDGIRQADEALRGRTDDQARAAAQSIESLMARNALALRVAANGRIGDGGDPCALARKSLTIAPAIAQRFKFESPDGRPLCQIGDIGETGSLPLVAPGDIQLRVAPDESAIIVRVGVVGGIATATIPITEIREAAAHNGSEIRSLLIRDGERELEVIGGDPPPASRHESVVTWPIANSQLTVRIASRVPHITTAEQLLMLLPLLMWVLAALVTWFLVTRLLIRPLRQLQRAVTRYRPGEEDFELPSKLGPATEIREFGDAFARTVARVEDSEREMASALDGQRRLVREVHHRVKNNLQVVASLLNIHGRSAESAAARAAYAAISRRVGALSIVHRNHFAEMEENRGIALRPLVSELAAELRAGAPEGARGLAIELDLESVNTTQDVAVSVSFLVTEIVEFAMLNRPDEPVEITLRRSSELTARLTISSPVLNPDESDLPEKAQFERIVSGLAKQLRSSLDRKLGRYSVELPAFPPA